MVNCVLIEKKETSDIDIEHVNISKFLGGPLEIAGAIPELNVVAVSLREGQVIEYSHLPNTNFEKNIKSKIVLVKTDEDADPVDIYASEIITWLNQNGVI